MLQILITLLTVLFVLDALLLILLVLMQRPKSEGLGAAFGGGMTENLFGAQTTNVLAKATRWFGGIFFLLTLLLSILYAHNGSQTSELNKKLLSAPVPTASATASPAKSAAPVASVAPAAPAASASPSAAGAFSLSTGVNPATTPAAPFSSPAATPAK
ncbi:MAG: preprotein translocase subunit SecG [Chthoniobacteraceae bacterium]